MPRNELVDRWERLQERVHQERLTKFTEIETDWLDLMWVLDLLRSRETPPAGMSSEQFGGLYRKKGNWFATAVALLLENRTGQDLAPRGRVQGFSQVHQIDVAWPNRDVDPLICLETKLTGAPSTPRAPERGAMQDWSNRRKELKFASTDLKLFRRQQETKIEHWGVWREAAAPKCYFLWAARLGRNDRPEKMISEVQALVKTYLDGAGIVAWQDAGDGYQMLPIPAAERVSTIDDVLYRVASEINRIAEPGQEPPPPTVPTAYTLNPNELEPDAEWQIQERSPRYSSDS